MTWRSVWTQSRIRLPPAKRDPSRLGAGDWLDVAGVTFCVTHRLALAGATVVSLMDSRHGDEAELILRRASPGSCWLRRGGRSLRIPSELIVIYSVV